MADRGNISPSMQYYALCVLGFIEDCFTTSPKETFSREKVLLVLNRVKNDPSFFDAEAVVLYDTVDAIVDKK